jgi:hypothetical protein
LLVAGAEFSEGDVKDSAVRVANAVNEPSSVKDVETALREELKRIDIDAVADKTAGVVVASIVLARVHHSGKKKGSWTSPSAFIDSSWRQSIDITDGDWRALRDEAKRKAAVNIGYAILTTATAMVDEANRVQVEAAKTGRGFVETWRLVAKVDRIIAREGFGAKGLRASQVTDATAAEGYGAEAYTQQSESGGYIGILTMDDGGVRPNHKKLHKLAWPADSTALHTVYPPNGLGCRCRAMSMASKKIAITLGFKIMGKTKIPSGAKPDKGFDSNPALKPYEPDYGPIPSWMIKSLGVADKILHIKV